MNNSDINNGLKLIADSLKWADDFGKDSFPRKEFKNYRRQMRTISEALSENCSAAAYGESQVGKSYLMGSLLSTPDAPFVIENKGIKYRFVDDLNPSGGKGTLTESTGVITRFTIRRQNDAMSDYVKVKNLSIVDIILMLTDSYYNDLTINAESIIRYDDINRKIDALVSEYDAKKPCQQYICEDDIKDIYDYVKDVIKNKASDILHSNFNEAIAPIIDRVPHEKWVDVFSLLWNEKNEISNLFCSLIDAYSKLDFKTEVYVPFDAVLKKKGTLLDIIWLDTVCGKYPELEDGEEPYTDVYDPSGQVIAQNFSKGMLSALIAEITFVLPESIANERKFLKKIDLLDLPGARSRDDPYEEEKINEDGVLPLILRRGKVAYLFNKYCRSKLISSVLFCHHNNQKASNIGRLISNWIEEAIGKTPEKRADFLNRTNGVSPLFMVCTKFNSDIQKGRNDLKGVDLHAHWERFKKIIPEILISENWFENWVPAGGRFVSSKFQSVYLLRDFYYSREAKLFDGWVENRHREESMHIFPDYPEYFDDLKASFLGYPFVKDHFKNPEQSWNDVATLNNDGSKAIIRDLDAIAEVLDSARRQKYREEMVNICTDIQNKLSVYHESESKEENNKKVRKISGDIKLHMASAIGSKPETFGKIIDDLMVKSSKLRTIVYDIIVRHIDEPMDISVIKLVRAECQINPSAPFDENIAKLCSHYSSDKDSLEKFFKDKGFSLEQVVKDDSEITSTVADVIAKNIIAYWTQNINEQVKSLESILPHADEVAFMLMNLLSKLGVKKEITEKVNRYYEIFDENSLPNAIADYSSLTLNNFVSTIGRDYLSESDIQAISEKAAACNLNVDLTPSGSTSASKPQPLLEVLSALDQSRSEINNDAIDMQTLRKLPFWDNYQRWENLVTIGLLYSSDISHVDPVANAAVNELIGRSISLRNC